MIALKILLPIFGGEGWRDLECQVEIGLEVFHRMGRFTGDSRYRVTPRKIRSPHTHQPCVPNIRERKRLPHLIKVADRLSQRMRPHLDICETSHSPTFEWTPKSKINHTPMKRMERHTCIYNKSHSAALGFCLVLFTDKGEEPRGYAALTPSSPSFSYLIFLSVFTLCCSLVHFLLFPRITPYARKALNDFLYFLFCVFPLFL